MFERRWSLVGSRPGEPKAEVRRWRPGPEKKIKCKLPRYANHLRALVGIKVGDGPATGRRVRAGGVLGDKFQHAIAVGSSAIAMSRGGCGNRCKTWYATAAAARHRAPSIAAPSFNAALTSRI